MSLDPPGTVPPLDEADARIAGAEIAPTYGLEPTPATAHPFDDLAIDTSAVMAVLREAIDRYTNGDGHGLAPLDNSVAAVPTVALDPPHTPRATGRDRRRLAGVVVVLFVVIVAVGYQRFTGGPDKVSTKTSTTVQGIAVTTLGRTTLAPATELPSPPPPSADTGGTTPATQQVTSTTHRTSTTSPPVTDPPVTDPVDTTPSTDMTTTTEQVTTTTTVTLTTTCSTDPFPVCS